MTEQQYLSSGLFARTFMTGVSRYLCAFTITLVLSACGSGVDTLNSDEEPPVGDDPPSPSPTPPPAPTPPPPAPPPPGPTDQAIFEATLYPHLVDANNFCAGCHAALQVPLFAAADSTAAYNAVVGQQKVNLANPPLSRLYLRPKDDRHNCGGDAICDRIADDFLLAIMDWANQAISAAPPPTGSGSLVSGMTDFSLATEGGVVRADDSAIALFTFSEGSGTTTMDTSGAGAPITLQIEGMEWVDGGGLRNVNGKAQASVEDSSKLFDMIQPVDEYSVEAWVIPENTNQDGPARIVSYSDGTQDRNFTMGQNAIYYQLRNRSAGTGANGTPALEALDPETDTVLQHVVMTFDAASGRKVYINGRLSIEENTADTLDWQDNYTLVIGNETTDNRLWQGVIRLVAIHNKALTPAEVLQNFDAGTGVRVTMRFDVSGIVGQDAFIDMQVAQIDAAGYLFAKPVFVSDATGIAVKNIRIGVNGGVPIAAQPFRRVDTIVMQNGTELSPLGALIPVELGQESDQFHLEFEALSNQFGQAEMIPPSSPPAPLPDTPEPELGVRTFSQINDTMSVLTGIDSAGGAVAADYTELRDSLPATSELLSFAAAQQIAIQRLATTYCGEIVNGNCDDFFGSCAIDANGKDAVANTLFTRFIGENLANQPGQADVTTEIVRVIDDLGCTGGCNGATAQSALQATCAAVLSSAAVTVN